jgi:hypothetical protein
LIGAALIGAAFLKRARFAGARFAAAVRACCRGSGFAGFLLRAAARFGVRTTEVFLTAGFLAAGRRPDFFAADRADRFSAQCAAFSARLRARLAALTAARACFNCNLTCFSCRLATLTASRAWVTDW